MSLSQIWFHKELIADKHNKASLEIAKYKLTYNKDKREKWLSFIDVGSKIDDKSQVQNEISLGISLPVLLDDSIASFEDQRQLNSASRRQSLEFNRINIRAKFLLDQIHGRYLDLVSDRNSIKEKLERIHAINSFGVEASLIAEGVLHEVLLGGLELEESIYGDLIELSEIFGVMQFDGYPFLNE